MRKWRLRKAKAFAEDHTQLVSEILVETKSGFPQSPSHKNEKSWMYSERGFELRIVTGKALHLQHGGNDLCILPGLFTQQEWRSWKLSRHSSPVIALLRQHPKPCCPSGPELPDCKWKMPAFIVLPLMHKCSFFLARMPGLLHQTFALWVPWIGNTKLIMAQSLLSWAPQRDALLRWLLPAPVFLRRSLCCCLSPQFLSGLQVLNEHLLPVRFGLGPA